MPAKFEEIKNIRSSSVNKKNIVIATIHSWNIRNYNSWIPPAGYRKFLISNRNKLTYKTLKNLAPEYIFFPHWSWIIPKEVYENFECVVFHMTDLPFGRGGSPLQNLLIRGIYKTKILAIRAVEKLDSGPIYLKKPLDIRDGSAQEIYERASKIISEMINYIITKNPRPKPQRGKVVIFKRRTPAQSEIPKELNTGRLYDFIRMLDAEGYLKAFLQKEGYRIEFSNAHHSKDHIEATARIFLKEK